MELEQAVDKANLTAELTPWFFTDLLVYSTDDKFTDKRGVYKFDPGAIVTAHAATQREVFYSMFLSPGDGRRIIVVDNTNLTPGERYHYSHLAELSWYHEVRNQFDMPAPYGVLVVDFRDMKLHRNLHEVPQWKCEQMLKNSHRDFREILPRKQPKYQNLDYRKLTEQGATDHVDAILMHNDEDEQNWVSPNYGLKSLMDLVKEWCKYGQGGD